MEEKNISKHKSFEDMNVTFGEIFELDVNIDINKIIESVHMDDDLLLDKKISSLLIVARQLSSVAHPDKMMSDFYAKVAFDISSIFRSVIHVNTSFECQYLVWLRIAADQDHFDALTRFVNYSIGHQIDKNLIEIWSKKAFKSGIKQLEKHVEPMERSRFQNELIGLIMKVNTINPKLALRYALEMLSYIREYESSNDNATQLNDYVMKQFEKNAWVRVLDQIGESDDRSVRQACERYESLVTHPVELIQVENIESIKHCLDDEFPWFAELTSKITKSLLLRQLGKSDFYLPPLVILGDYGIGKTSYINRLSQLVNVPYRSLSLAGKNDNRDLMGTSRGWSSGQPSMIITLINESKIGNPIVILDELDKAGGSDQNGRILDSLLTLFEPTSAKRVFDEYLAGHADLSHVTWMATANSIKQIPGALLSRLDVCTVNGPLKEHYPAIVRKSIDNFCKNNGIHKAHVPQITQADWKWFERYYKSPRLAKRAAEKWLSYALLNPIAQTIN